MKRKYELTVIFSPQLSSSDLTKAQKTIKDLVAKVDGKIVKSEDWGTRKLAYEVNKQTEGVYRFFIVELPPDALSKLDREFKLLTEILRYLFVIFEE